MTYDLIIIGAGPAGLIAAVRALERGARVLVLERNARPGVKLLLTGGGRCNLTNLSERSPRQFAARFGRSGRFLIAALTRFGAAETIDLFRRLGVPTVTEASGKVYPQSGRAADLRDALLRRIIATGGTVRTGIAVRRPVGLGGAVARLQLADGSRLTAPAYLIATGGASYPATGSTGDGFRWLRSLGHTVVPPRPALAPIAVRERTVSALAGVSLPRAAVSVRRGAVEIARTEGGLLFTATGVSGPAVHDASRHLIAGDRLALDLAPESDPAALDRALQTALASHGRQRTRTVLAAFIPAAAATAVCAAAGVDPDRLSHAVVRAERLALVSALTAFPLTPRGAPGFDQAMATAGGVALAEVDPKTMRSKLVPNLFLAGEVLDLDGPTGGYNLQAAWSTGWVAGDSVAIVHTKEAV